MAWCETKVAVSEQASLAIAASFVKGFPASFKAAALYIISSDISILGEGFKASHIYKSVMAIGIMINKDTSVPCLRSLIESFAVLQ